MNKIKQAFQMIFYNIKPFIIFELIFKVLSLLIFSPLFIKTFNFIMKITGYNYLTLENITSFMKNPLTICLLLLLILLMMVYTMFDITTIIIILDSSYQKKKITVSEAVLLSLKKCRSMFHIKNILLAFMTLFIIPFLHMGINSSFIQVIHIPEFIMQYIVANKMFLAILVLFVILLFILLLRWLYALHYFVLEGVDFKTSRQKSVILSQHKHLKDIFTLLLIQVVSFLLYLIFVLLGVLIIYLINKVCKDIILLKSFLNTVIWVFIALSFIIFTLLATPISYAGISALFYLHKQNRKEAIVKINLNTRKKNKKESLLFKRILIPISIVCFMVALIFTYGVYKGNFNLNVEHLRKIEVTAHRGASLEYPENTMSAFVGAKDLGADWIELDVQQTKDKKLVISHDSNLERTAKIKKRITKMTYEELKDIDVGSFFSEDFKGERIPTLESVILWAKENNIRLNIELKPKGEEVDFETSVVDLIKEYDFQDRCVVASQVYSVLEKVKKYDSTINTLYVMSLAVGDILSFDQADHFSIEASNVTKKMVNYLHKEGKELYVWTINTEDNIRNMIDLKVDNIITDDVTLVKNIIYESKTSNLISEYIKFIENNFN